MIPPLPLVLGTTTVLLPALAASQALSVPATPPASASKYLDRALASLSIEPAYFADFFGTSGSPNEFALKLLQAVADKTGVPPAIRPGGITQDSAIYDPNLQGGAVRSTSPEGGIFRTTYGSDFFSSWTNFPNGTEFVATLNFGNDSIDIARDEALAALQHAGSHPLIAFELGNEPSNYARWEQSGNATVEYVQEWVSWTSQIDSALDSASPVAPAQPRWWGSSATVDSFAASLKPADILPLDVDQNKNIKTFSLHSYAYSTCDAERIVNATIENMLNHTAVVDYANTYFVPSAQAAFEAGTDFVVGEFNSISCSGRVNVTDTFAQALWTVDTTLNYAAINATRVYLHQGATLVFQSNDQENTAGDDGSPGWSAYNLFYPTQSSLRGEQRVNPGFVSQLFIAEAVGSSGKTRLAPVSAPSSISNDNFAAYALYDDSISTSSPARLAILNLTPYRSNGTSSSLTLDISSSVPSGASPILKRMTAPSVDEKDSAQVTYAGQSWKTGEPVGEEKTETVQDGKVTLRASEAVLVYLDGKDTSAASGGGNAASSGGEGNAAGRVEMGNWLVVTAVAALAFWTVL